jgi:hypothetical protein
MPDDERQNDDVQQEDAEPAQESGPEGGGSGILGTAAKGAAAGAAAGAAIGAAATAGRELMSSRGDGEPDAEESAPAADEEQSSDG